MKWSERTAQGFSRGSAWDKMRPESGARGECAGYSRVDVTIRRKNQVPLSSTNKSQG